MSAIVINASTGVRHLKGQKRLEASLREHWGGPVLMYEGWAMPGYDQSNPYTIKAALFERVIRDGFTTILWLDASCVAIRNIQPIFDRIQEHGYYLASSGYSAAQTCTDRQLKAVGITRNEAVAIPDTATGTIGIHLNDISASAFIHEWIQWGIEGLFGGSRTHDPSDSADPRFLFGRQDQSAATLLAHLQGMRLDYLGGLTAYDGPNLADTVCVKYQGIE
jgi:hypothetical protein